MSGTKRKYGKTSLDESLRASLGIGGSGKRLKKTKTRKELRKEARSEKRHKTQTNFKKKEPQLLPTQKHSTTTAALKPSKKNEKKEFRSKEVSSDMRDPEDEEIERLERLLGVKSKGGSKKKAAEKLNKEYEMYEGITGNFGDFLMQLDDLTESIHKGNYRGVFKDEDGSDEEFEVSNFRPPILDDSEQEGSDIEVEEDDDDEDEGSDKEGGDSDGGGSEGEEEEDEESDGDDQGDYSESDGDDEEEEESEKDRAVPAFIYRPTPGEDIYGRPVAATGAGNSGGKYVPPARRQHVPQPTTNPSSVIDESSESFRLLKRQLNGQLNRLSEQTRDSVLKALGDLFKGNSLTILCHILKQYILSVCGNPSQLMESLVPLYASLVAALHISVHHDIGSYLLESLTLKLMEGIKETSQQPSQEHALISDKTSTNILLFLVYLYNLRVVHHRLIMDILEHLITASPESSTSSRGSSSSPLSVLSPVRVELILCVIEHCGPTLRTDDPQGLKSFIVKLNSLSSLYSADTSPKDPSFDGRLHFMISSISDLKNNKSRRSQNVHSEAVAVMKRWLGRVKSSRPEKGSDGSLTMSLQDLLQAETIGRWWRAGASWVGRDQSKQQQAAERRKGSSQQSVETSAAVNDEEQLLLKLANKFRMNTSVKRDIFVVVMSSRDATDAFERLSRLDLKGKQDREIIRVIATVCGLEKTYNEFYGELLAIFCGQNRQNRTTLQYVFWDFFKALMNESNSPAETEKHLDRKAINMARLLAKMVTDFHLSLSVLKVLDMSGLTSHMMLFLATFFLALFSTKISDQTFASVLDRIATTSDCLLVRENVMFFLQKHLETFPAGLPEEELKLMKKRRKQTLHTLDSMSVLDIAQGLKEKELEKKRGKGADEDDLEEEDF